MNKRIVHDALVLTAFTLVLGCILGLVHEITKAPIAAAEEATTQAAYKEVFADADSFVALDGFDSDAATAAAAAAGYEDSIDDVEQALDADGNVLGYVITATANDGSQASITLSVGITNDGTVNGYSITDISETPGLGAKATDEDFSSQFDGKTVSAFTVVKTAATSDEEIEAITGATITSKAVTNAVNASLNYYQTNLSTSAQATLTSMADTNASLNFEQGGAQ